MSGGVRQIDALSPEDRRTLLATLLRERTERPQVRPASYAQERLWFLEQLSPGTPFFNIDVAVAVQAPLSPAVVEQSINEIVRRHEVLRTTFAAHDGRPMQTIAPALLIPVPVIDLSDVPEADRRARAIQAASEEARRPFDLARGPLLRVALLRLGDADFVFLLTMHHIVSDGWSIGVLLDELRELYAAYSAGRPSPLPELPVQYADYAAWQREWLQGAVLDEQIAYWRDRLAGASTLALPTDRPRPLVPTHQGAYQPVSIPEVLTEQLRALSRREGATLFMTLLAAFNVLLHRYTGQSDLVVGTYVANRDRAEVERLIGFFINTLVMRTDTSGDPPFVELLRRVRETALGAYAHQDMPFTRLVEALQPDRDLSRNPLFQVVFQLVAPAGNDGEQPAAHSSNAALQVPWRRAATLDLVFSLADRPGGLAGGIEYSTELFDADTIARLIRHFEVLLSGIAQEPSERISRLPLLTGPERRLLLHDWNDTAREYPTSTGLMTRFAEAVDRYGDRVAFTCGGESMSYSQLDLDSSRLANYLRAIGVETGRLVGIALPRSLEAVSAVIGVLKAGCACVPVDPAYPAERLEFILDDARPDALIADRPVSLATAAGIPIVQLAKDAHAIRSMPGAVDAVDAGLDDAAFVIYTSGSTGRPKGALVGHAQILNRLHWMWQEYPFEPDDVDCQKTALTFIDSIWELLGPLLRGTPSVIVPDEIVRDPAALVPLLARHGVTRLWLVPSLLAAILDRWPDLGRQLPALRFWVSSGEALRPALVARFRAAHPGARLYNLYGTSEVWDAAWFDTSREEPLGLRVPIGFPIGNVRAYILDPEGQMVPIGVAGELHVGGAAVGQGYLRRPDLTASRFVPDPFREGASLYRTGDRARHRADGAIELIDRMDRQVKVRGHRVEADEIEALVRECPGVRDAAIVARESDDGEVRLVAFVAASEDADVGTWRESLRRRIPEHMIPERFIRLGALPMTPSGKVDRQQLAAMPEQAEPSPRPRNDRPYTPVEAALCALCADVFGVEHVGVDDHFFMDLGGHSLLATRLIARIRDRFGVDLPLRHVFEQPTMAGLARALAANGAAAPATPAIRRAPRQRQIAQISDNGVLERLVPPGEGSS